MQDPHETKETMFSLIRQWQSSGISQKAFCEQHDVRYHIFHYWYKRFKDDRKIESPSAGRFVHLQTAISTGAFAEIAFASGSKIILHQPVAADYLKALL